MHRNVRKTVPCNDAASVKCNGRKIERVRTTKISMNDAIYVGQVKIGKPEAE